MIIHFLYLGKLPLTVIADGFVGLRSLFATSEPGTSTSNLLAKFLGILAIGNFNTVLPFPLIHAEVDFP